MAFSKGLDSGDAAATAAAAAAAVDSSPTTTTATMISGRRASRTVRLAIRAITNIMVVVALAVIVATVGYFNKLEGFDRTDRGIETYVLSTFNTSKMYPVTAAQVPDEQTRFCVNHNYIGIEANVSFVDPLQDILKVRLKFIPCGDFGDFTKTMGSSIPLKVPINMTFGSTVLTFKEKAVMSPGKEDSLPVFFASGDINAYPYDVYTTNVEYITALYMNKDNVTLPCPLSLSLIGALQAWSFQLPVVADVSKDVLETNVSDGTLIAFQLVLQRSWTVKFFSFIITAIIWILPCLALFLAVTLVQTSRTPEPPVMSMSISLLFALPAVRNSQPQVPPFGTTLDAFSFYLAYMLEAVTAILLLVRYIERIEVKSMEAAKPAPAPAEATDDDKTRLLSAVEMGAGVKSSEGPK
ncbi:hypothetical protein DFJ73DRAFT_848003 [Zopfochytrium polystomum]|nr:hypothetical protein DFJ73DRAFT_848003 [Zopfochytrium polystomum]